VNSECLQFTIHYSLFAIRHSCATMPNLQSLLTPILEHAALRGAAQALTAAPPGAGAPLTISGLTSSAKALVVAGVSHKLLRPLVVLTSDNETATHLQRTTSTFLGWLEPLSRPDVLTLPALDCSPYENRSPHAEVLEQRAVTLWRLARGRARVLYVPLPAALGRYRERAFYSSLALELKLGDELDLADLTEHLSGVGYERAEPVSDVGQFSVRGGMVDVFPPEVEWPVRLEFFGDRIESLREFDPATQRSRKPVPAALLLPLAEVNRSRQFFEKLIRALGQRASARETVEKRGSPRSELEPEWAAEYSNPFPGWEFLATLVDPHPNTLFALLDNPILIWDEPLDRKAQAERLWEGLAAGFEEVRDVIPPRPRPGDIFLTEEEFAQTIGAMPQLYLKELSLSRGVESRESRSEELSRGVESPDLRDQELAIEGESPLRSEDGSAYVETSMAGASPGPTKSQSELVLLTQPSPKFQGGVKGLVESLQGSLGQGRTVIFVVPTSGKADRLREILTEYEIPFGTVDGGGAPGGQRAPDSGQRAPDGSQRAPDGGQRAPDGDQRAPDGGHRPPLQASAGLALMAQGDLAEGFVIPDLGQMWVADSDLFGGFDWAPRRRGHTGISTFISDLGDLKVGDYVVHVDHGIAVYQGLRQLSVSGSSRDFMLLTYQDDARLYVPLERLDLVEKYRSGGDGVKPVLDRLGGSTWERTKTRVKRALRDMAQELLHLYAERKMHGGSPNGPDTPWQKEFEEAFEFEETPDQLKALADIKKDLESPEPMDRLLCGDVGYGKTELAMRAAFKVIQEGRQAAVLAPTTVLAYQHYTTFGQRMAAFPMRVEMLSRFRSAAEQKKIVAEVEAGKVDVLIGTHRLLSKDVRFRDLGLLIVDEEQRFGVAAKEKLKKLKAGVDVLAMSATPIPRTLHMSLGGLRDLSVIETPPRGRLAIQTTVASFNPPLIQSAILQEMQREGQVFFVHNRVESIFSVAAIVQRLVPTARIGVAHGQMGEKELEKVMLKFMQGDYDVLVATTLIENGLDIPRANTMIVNHADRFGLADLYQLRGRVGRSNRRAYAYFLVAAEETLTPTARRRLAALKEFSELGSGFRLAALDLELRGAGNLLGAEQHGHLTALGIDLYLKMLEQTVEELKGAPQKMEVRTTLNLGLDIKIPDHYIADESQRLRMYKRVSSLATSEARAELEVELSDRYGPIPASVSNLLSYALLKSAAEQLLVQSIERKADDIWMRFHEQAPVDLKRLTAFVRRRREASLRPDGVLRFKLQHADENTLQEVQNVLQELRPKD
jgi:transcription-repair coupling factor (superfamily II helicase)